MTKRPTPRETELEAELTRLSEHHQEWKGQIQALHRSSAVIEFDLDGTVRTANENFCSVMGYSLDEVRGRHHRMFVPVEFAQSSEYERFWQHLAAGNFISGQYLRRTKDGREVWLQASYNPIFDAAGRPVKVVKFATDITAEKLAAADAAGQLAAIDKAEAVIEFELDGTIRTANQNFLEAVGYSLDEIRGRHHRMFVDAETANSPAYRKFWEKLGGGEMESGQYRRFAKGGREIWLQASYNPILDPSGRPFKVVKYATDITEDKLREADFSGQLAAIHTAQAVIEFELDGTIRTANKNFLDTVGYSLDEIRGKHHRMFIDPDTRASAAYEAFWRNLGQGKFDTGQYLRIGKGGREIWLQASYNPILDPNGRPFKVVKYATDITEAKLREADFSGQMAAISKAQAVIEFELDGTIRTANENFCAAVGYERSEIVGKHHSLFVTKEERSSQAYKLFWERLGRGELDSGQYQRVAKGGRTLWLQASYNPVLDPKGRPFKVVKYATDITAQKDAAIELERVMNETLRIMTALSEGDLQDQMEGQFRGDFARLKEAVNSCISNLRNLVGQIASAAGEIAAASTEIAEGNSDLSRRSEQQAASLEETAASMEELTSTVKQNASNASTANQLAAGARQEAERGGSVVQDAISGMSEINSASKKIADIIGVIDEIAFQTNLLALNAAVEAARAGEQGRGFAVVASEVRNLAQRSAGAAKEIKALINDSVEKVEAGSRLVNQSGDTLTKIVEAVNRVSEIVGDIAAASEEQASGIEQVNRAVADMDNNVQQNAALVEQAAASSEAMSEQSRVLTDLIGSFRTGNESSLDASTAGDY